MNSEYDTVYLGDPNPHSMGGLTFWTTAKTTTVRRPNSDLEHADRVILTMA